MCNFCVQIKLIILYKLIKKIFCHPFGSSITSKRRVIQKVEKLESTIEESKASINKQQKIFVHMKLLSCGISCCMMLCPKDFSSNNFFNRSLNPSKAVQCEGTKGGSGSPQA